MPKVPVQSPRLTAVPVVEKTSKQEVKILICGIFIKSTGTRPGSTPLFFLLRRDGGARLPLKLVALALDERLLDEGESYHVRMTSLPLQGLRLHTMAA